MTRTALCIGECMVEFSPRPDGSFAQGFAGDTFNMAWYLRRSLTTDWAVRYFTALGDDRMSDRMLDFIGRAGIGTDHVPRLPGLAPGLYVIALQDGERSFAYWRGQSAARHLARDPAVLARALAGIGLLVFSGITLAILPAPDRQSLLDAVATARKAGSRVVFDPNIRPRLWEDADTLRHWIARAAALADIVLPSFDDESRHFGDATPAETARRYRQAGAGRVIVKNGGEAVHWSAGPDEGQLDPPRPARIVDTTAAGDSFNAGFLAAHLAGHGLRDAVAQGSALAARVIQAPGALVDV